MLEYTTRQTGVWWWRQIWWGCLLVTSWLLKKWGCVPNLDDRLQAGLEANLVGMLTGNLLAAEKMGVSSKFSREMAGRFGSKSGGSA